MKHMFLIIPLLALMTLNIANGASPADKQKPKESVYVHTDRDVYMPGDTIKIRAFLFDADRGILADYSRYVYVDLLNANGVILGREKIAYDAERAILDGYYPLSKMLRSGEYELRAYTYYMQNQGIVSFFRKNITIGYSVPLLANNSFDKAAASNLLLLSKREDKATSVTLSLPASLGVNFANLSVSVVKEGYVSEGICNIVSYVSSIPSNIPDSVSDKYFMERGVVLSGWIIDHKGNNVRKSEIDIICEDNKSYRIVTDMYGHFECPVMWDSKTRFYAQKVSNKKDVWIIYKRPEFLTHVNSVLQYAENGDDNKDPYGWTNDEVVIEKYPVPMKAETPYMTLGGGVSGPTTYSTPNPGMKSSTTSDAFRNNTLNPYEGTPLKMVVKRKRKKNIQKLAYWAPQPKCELYASGATCYWNTEVVVRNGEPFEFSFPTAADSRAYTVVVNGVDNNGNPIGGVWRIEN